MGFTLIASNITPNTSGVTGIITTPPLDTTGADLIVVMGDSAASTFSMALTDSYGNNSSYNQLTVRANSRWSTCLFWIKNPIVGTGHAFTLAAGSSYGKIGVLAFSGSAASPFQAESGFATDANVVGIQPGSITPLIAGSLCVTGLNGGNNVGFAIDSGFSALVGDVVPGQSIGGGIGWFLQNSSASPLNPTWSCTGGFNASSELGGAAAMAVFNPAVAWSGGGPFPWFNDNTLSGGFLDAGF
jgi:hypothetical protein